MTVPAPVQTVTPNTAVRTYSNPTPNVTLADTQVPSPAPIAPNGRSFRADGVQVAATTGVVASIVYPVNLAAGVRAMTVRTTNSDGNATSTGVNLTVTDSVAAGLDTGYGVNAAVPYRTLTDVPGKTRLDPNTLPDEWLDPTVCTAGLPTATALVKVRATGSI